ncbi:hypothetical protein GQ43DRAFT_486696 [Delitschia confertaspora ATCC 74209]|uniref:Uncharacterized protein n=1 Tax=Delitschia confertaspora ATCC 74209 TaxID=1513339 RepID=A0A9P4JNV2_9PLEO|nr:hypothetical protein GQ43DRAFT_486696 [Delitschia confertaspora ATCC 74209]
MLRPSVPEIREDNEHRRPSSFGPQLLEHYESGVANELNESPPPNHHGTISPSSAFIDIHHDTRRNIQFTDVSSLQETTPTRPLSLPRGTRLNQDIENQPTEIGGPPLIRLSTAFVDRIITDWWWWELFSWLVSFAAVVAIIAILIAYNGKPPPGKIMFGITLNAYISIFSAVGKAALILPVSEAIGQLKWIWFRRESKLWDFFTFDSASRGPWGSLMLLGRTRCRRLVSLGAAITILALAFEPFFQQIVTYPIRTVADSHQTSSISVAMKYREENVRYVPSDGNAAVSSMGQVITGQFMLIGEPVREPPSQCSTGNCTFPEYSSLSVCHQCVDLSYTLEYVCANYTRLELTGSSTSTSHPCGYKLNGTLLVGTTDFHKNHTIVLSAFAVGDDMKTDVYWNSTTFADFTFPIIDFYLAYTPGGPEETRKNSTPVMINCLLSWCIKTYQARHISGVLHETATKAVLYNPEPGFLPSATNSSASYNEVSITTSDNKTYTVPNGTTKSIRTKLRQSMPTFISSYDGGPNNIVGVWNFLLQPPYDFASELENLTTEMTSAMRRKRSGSQEIHGTVWTPQSYVKVEWVWVSLPVGLLFGSLVFLLFTILKSRRQGIGAWKSSALSMLLYGINGEARRKFDVAKKTSEIEAMSKVVRVKLAERKGTTRLVPV